jgi:hypothetical protein
MIIVHAKTIIYTHAINVTQVVVKITYAKLTILLVMGIMQMDIAFLANKK